MTREELDIILRQEVIEAIDANIERDPLKIALDRHIPYAREVATQVKYLQRAKHKLPSLYEVRAILPPRAFEQSSSEKCAAAKQLKGENLLELTCGLGIDAIALSRHFRHITTLERDEVLADVVRENLRRLGIQNVEVINTSAEDFLSRCNEHFDWVYADPDRRTTSGKRVFRMEECSPNIIELKPHLQRITRNLVLKLSPLFDTEEAFRIFGNCRVEVVSLDNECKEVMVYADGSTPTISAHAIGKGVFSLSHAESMKQPALPEKFDIDNYKYLILPDVALQKARLTRHALQGKADIWSDYSFGFAHDYPNEVLGRIEPIQGIEPFNLKQLKSEMKGKGVDIILGGGFRMGVDEIRRRCSMRSGEEHRIALCNIGGKDFTILLK